jgi:TonB family protein
MRGSTRALVIVLVTLFSAVSAHSQNQDNPPASKGDAARPMRIRVGGNVARAKLNKMVDPVYPSAAKAAGVSGTVILHAVISKDGTVQQVEVISGPPLLLESAMDAVKQWRYEPTLLNGQPVEVDTTISVAYRLGAPDPSPPQESSAIDPQYRADVMLLLEISHFREAVIKAARTSFDSTRSKVAESFPDTPNRNRIVDAFGEKLVALVQSQDFTDQIVSVYFKYLSDEDVKSLAQFYETPAGQRFSATEVDMTNDLGQVGTQFGRDRVAGIFKDLCVEYPELQGHAKFCPLNNGDDKS